MPLVISPLALLPFLRSSCSYFFASPLLSVPHPAVPSSSLPAFQPQGVSGFYPPDFSLLPSYSLTWPVSSAPGWALLRWFQWFLVTCGALPGASLFSAASVCSAPIGPSAGLYGFASPLSRPSEAPCLHAVLLLGAPGFSAASSLTPFALFLLPPLQVSLSFPQLRLAPSLISLALLLSLALLRLMLRCLGLLRLLPSSSLSVWLGSSCPFGPGLWLRPLPVLWLRFLRLSFLTFACLRLRWCLT